MLALLDWYGVHARDLPWRRTRDPYAIWVSEIMLQQTQVKTVIPYWERWVEAFPDVASLAAAPEARVLKLWEGLGYYRRARHLHAAARVILERHGGVFPGRLDAVLALPGVGRYTAGAVCSIAFDQAVPILDGNVIRVLCRVGALAGDPKDRGLNSRLWEEAGAWIGLAASLGRKDACSHLNQALMELGAMICTPRAPACDRCPLAPGCRARAGGAAERYPELAKRARATVREYVVAVIEHRGRVWVRQRLAEDVNGGLWEFPNVEVAPGKDGAEGVLRRALGDGLLAMREPLVTVRHAITRYRVTQRAILAEWGGGRRSVPGGGLWCGVEEIEALPMSSAHRKIALAWRRRRDGLHLD